MADIDVSVTRAAANTTTGNQTFTGNLGGKTPKAALFFISQGVTDGTAANHASIGVGATDGTNEWAISTRTRHNVATTEADGRGATSKCIQLINSFNTSVNGEASFVSFSADSVTINWTNALNAAYLVEVVLFGGADLSAHVNTATLGNSGIATTVTGVGFNPDAVLSFFNNSGINNTSVTTSHFTIGVASSTAQKCYAYRALDANTVEKVSSIVSSSYGVGEMGPSSLTWGGTFSNFGADGFDVTPSANANNIIGFLALNGITGYIGTYSTPTTSGNNSHTGVGFTPQAVLHIETMHTSVDTAETGANASPFGIGVQADNEYVMSLAADDGAATTNSQSLSDNQVINLPTETGASNFAGTHVSFDSDGWTNNYTATNGTARTWIAFAISQASNSESIPSTTLTLTTYAPSFTVTTSPNNYAIPAGALKLSTFAPTASVTSAGTTYYVDATSGSDSNTGLSDAQAWQTLSKVNSFAFSTSDRVYFKCGETWSVSGGTAITIDWTGISSDNAIIGAYYISGGNEVIGVSGNKPIIDGGYDPLNTPGHKGISWYFNTFNITGSYVTVENIRVNNHEGRGIGTTGAYVTIKNCYTYYGFMTGLYCKTGGNVLFENNVYEESSRVRFDWGVSPYPSNMILDADNCTARGNICIGGGTEGLASFKNRADNVIEDNIIFSAYALGIYAGTTRTIVRNNIVLGSTDTTFHRYTGYCGPGIIINREVSAGTVDGLRIYNNLIAFCKYGIGFWYGATGNTYNDIDVYANTVVDCDAQLQTFVPSAQMTNIRIKDNIFCSYSGTSMTSGTFGASADIDYNCWSSAVTGNYVGANDVVGDPLLSKTSGWQSLSAYTDVTASDFSLTSTSPARNQGLLITGFETDYNGVTRDAVPDIGAQEYASTLIQSIPAAFLNLTTFAPSVTYTGGNKSFAIPSAMLKFYTVAPIHKVALEDPIQYPLAPNFLPDWEEWLRQVVFVLNGTMLGKTNNTGVMTLAPNTTTTTVTLTSGVLGEKTVINFMPLSANAAAETMYVSSRDVTNKTFTVTHSNAATTDRKFYYTFTG